MKSLIFASGIILGTLMSLSLSAATESSSSGSPTELQGQGRDDGGHGHTHHYHYSHGQELFSGDEWLLAVPLLLIPIIALGCWYFWGGKDEGYGWDRMGYSESSNYTPGAYESRMYRGADSLTPRTHQRIIDAIQQ